MKSFLAITANHQSTLLVHHGSLDVQLANLRQDQVEHVAAVRKWKWTPARSGSRRNPASGSPPACPHVLQMEDRLGLRHLG